MYLHLSLQIAKLRPFLCVLGGIKENLKKVNSKTFILYNHIEQTEERHHEQKGVYNTIVL